MSCRAAAPWLVGWLAWSTVAVAQQQPPDPVAAARRRLDEALAGDGKAGWPAADAWRAYGMALAGARQAESAVAALRSGIELRERLATTPDQRAELLLARFELGNALRMGDRFAEALAVYTAVPDRGRLDLPGLAPKRAAQVRIAWLRGVAQIRLLVGDTAPARALLEEALTVCSEHLDRDHADALNVRQTLSVLLAMTGESEAARSLAAEVLATTERLYGPDHQRTANAAFMLGQYERQAGRLHDGMVTLERALRLRTAALGQKHPDTLAAHFALLQCLAAGGEHERAARSAADLLPVARERLGADHHQVVDLEALLAEVLSELGRASDALPLAEHVVERRSRVPNERPGAQAAARLILARVLHALQRADEALAQAELAQELDDGSDPTLTRHIEQRLAHVLVATGRDTEALQHARNNLAAFDDFLARQLPVLRDEDRVDYVQKRRQDLDLVLTWSTTPEEVAAAHRDCIAWKAQVARGLFAQRDWLRRNLDAATVAQCDELQRVMAELALAEQKGDAAAAQRLRAERLRRLEALPTAATSPEAVAPATLWQQLGRDEVLADFHVFERTDRKGERLGPHLMAFVVHDGGRTQRVDFGPVAPIEAAAQGLLRVVARASRPLDAPSRQLGDVAGARVSALVWAPLAAAVGTARRVFVCADGPVALVPFGVLPDGKPDVFLIERLEFVSLVSPSDLGMAVAAPARAGGRSVLVGDVDYGPADAARFPALPATAKEVVAIAEQLAAARADATILRGKAATPAAVAAAVAGANFVHFATHGVYAGDAASTLPGYRGALAFAGANTAGATSADALAWWDLRECRLVVLSACDTAAGELPVGEHVLGLRRALRLAGAGATITSAWAIDDTATGALMADFYRRFVGGVAPATALREAQLAMLVKNRAAGDAMPGTWGAFLFEGR